MNILSNYPLSDVPRLTGVALLYALAIYVALSFLTIEKDVSILWIPSGIGLAIVLLGGRKYLPSILVGAMLVYLLLGRTVLFSTISAVSDLLVSWLTYCLLTCPQIRNNKFNLDLNHPRDYFWLGAVSAFTVFLMAFIAVILFWWEGVITFSEIQIDLAHWWMSDTLGIIVVTPFILLWRKPPLHWLVRNTMLELIACFGITYVVGQVIFMDWFKAGFVAPPYLEFIFVTWAAVRFGRHGSVLIIIMIILQALQGAKQGVQFFATDSYQNGLLNYWLYTLVLTVVGTTLSLIIYHREQAETRLKKLVGEIAATNQELERVSGERYIALNAAAESLKNEREMAEAQRQFVMIVSHEFRTPLAIIDAANQNLRLLTDHNDINIVKRIKKINQAVDRLKLLMDRTLSRERLESGSMMTQPVSFELAAWVAEQFKVAQLMASNHRVTLVMDDDLSNNNLRLSGDIHLLSVAWMNLLDNAAKFSPEDSTIRLGVRLEGEMLVLEVSDEGPGIPITDMPKLFNKFTRGTQVQGIAGAGLGLYLTQRIAELHGGTVTLVNTYPGCRATLRLNLFG